MRQLIVNADDFGLTPGVNRGIIEAFRAGIVTSTTLMVNMSGFADAVNLIRENPDIAVGLHLNLTYGAPLLGAKDVPSLVGEDGLFRQRPQPVWAEGLIPEMHAEFLAQVKRFRKTGFHPSHLDTHHHLHQDERVLDLVVEIAQELGVTIRALDPEALCLRGLVPKARFLNYFGEKDGAHKLIHLIRALPEGVTEIPCHPGYCDDQLKSLSTLNIIRERELVALTAPEVRSAINQCNVKLTTYLEV